MMAHTRDKYPAERAREVDPVYPCVIVRVTDVLSGFAAGETAKRTIEVESFDEAVAVREDLADVIEQWAQGYEDAARAEDEDATED